MSRFNTCSALGLNLLIAATVVAALGCDVARAQTNWPVVRIQIRSGQETGFCSAVCIDPRGVFLTAAHCGDGSVTLISNDGTTYPAVIEHRDDVRPDGVMILRSIGGRFPATRIGNSVSVGDSVRAAGYPEGGSQWSVRKGKVTGFSSDGQIITSIRIAQGMSGGPLTNDQGMLVGLSSATAKDGGDYSVFVPIAKIKRSVRFAATLKQRIVVFSRHDCLWCRKFEADVKYFAAFDVLIVKFGDANYAAYESAYHKTFRRHVTSVPTFWLLGMGVYRDGYGGHRDLLAWISSIDKRGQGRRPGPITTDGSPSAPAPPAERQPGKLTQSIDALRQRLDRLTTLPGTISKIDGRLLGLQDRIESRKPVDLSPILSRLKSIESRKPAAVDLAPLAAKVGGVAAAVGTMSAWLPWVAGLAGTGATGGILGLVFAGLALAKRGRGVIKSVEEIKGLRPGDSPQASTEDNAGLFTDIVQRLRSESVRPSVDIGPIVQPDGTTQTPSPGPEPDNTLILKLFREALALAQTGDPAIGKLGGPIIAKAISDYVARRYATINHVL